MERLAENGFLVFSLIAFVMVVAAIGLTFWVMQTKFHGHHHDPDV